MDCGSCGHDNRMGAAFCEACGSRLPLLCGSCNNELRPGARFCDACGTPQGTGPGAAVPTAEAVGAASRDLRDYTPRHLRERILTSRSAIEGERKHVTVLFADVAGFTSISERNDPELIHGIMERCFQVILDGVHRYEGTVNQFTGDGAMALFGAPVAVEQTPRLAILAALEIQQGMEVLRAELKAQCGIDFRLRIGINSGPVVVGRIGDDLRMDYTAVGDTTNLAARLQQIAEPGTILISQTTAGPVRGFFELADRGRREVKGRSEPVQAYQVTGERPVSGRIEAVADQGLSPLVGRDRELDTLGAAFATAREGRGQVAFLVGEAGIGKSRLLYEFRRGLGDVPHAWLEGRCASYGRGTAFLAIADALRRFFGIDDRDDDAAALARLDAGVAALGADLDWILPFVRGLLSLPVGDAAVGELDPATRRSETFRAVGALLLQLAQRQPTVFVVEDLHWIDPASEELLGYLADSVPGARVLLVLTQRPGYGHPFGDRSYHVRLGLQALTTDETHTLAGSVLEGAALPEDLRRLIASKADGNPFFVEEITKSLLDEGVLQVEEGRVRVARAVAEISVPDSIQDVIMARIDRLSDEPKRAIQVASVIGREFALRLLERISQAGDRVASVVGELRALELIYEKTAHPELAFMFKHALTHDVAYESVLVQKRKALHRMVGAAIEELYADRLAEQYEALAHHFTRGEDWEQALRFHELAAEKAVQAYSHHTAIEHGREALAIAERLTTAESPGDAVDDERRARLHTMVGLGCWLTSQFQKSATAFENAAQCTSDPGDRGICLGHAAHAHHWAHSHERAEQAYREARELGRRHRRPDAEAIGLLMEGFHEVVVRGNTEFYVTSSDEAARLAERAGNPEIEGLAHFFQAEVAEWNGNYRRSLELCDRTIAIGRRLRLPHLVVWPKWFIGKSACCLGDYGRALAELRGALELTDRIGDEAWKSRILNTLGWCLAEIGAHEPSRAFNEQGAASASAIGDPEIIANAEINLAINHFALGDPDAAAAHLDPIAAGLASADPFQRWRYTLHLLNAQARLALGRGEPERALAHAEAELSGARRCHGAKIEARALETTARALVALDRRGDAAERLAATLEIARRIGYPPASWRAMSLQAELRRRDGDAAGAERLVAEAQSFARGFAPSLPDSNLRRGLLELGARLGTHPEEPSPRRR